MEVGQDARTDHHLLMSELRDAVAQIHCAALPANAEALVTALQLALSDGLRSPDDGFWPAVSFAVHSETRRLVEATASPRRRGRAWLRLALAESSLGAHLRLLSREASVRRAYNAGAIFTSRGPQVAALCDRLPDLSLLLLGSEVEAESSGSSLASPGDSGVALTTDSEADATSLHGLRDVEDWEERCHADRNEPVVVRRPRRKKCKAKRVSFHDDPTPESMETDACQGERGDPEGQEDPSRPCTASLMAQPRVDGDRVKGSSFDRVSTEGGRVAEGRVVGGRVAEGRLNEDRVDGDSLTSQPRVEGDRVDGDSLTSQPRVEGDRVDGDSLTSQPRVEGDRVDAPKVDKAVALEAWLKCRLNAASSPSRSGLIPRPSVFIESARRDRAGDAALLAALALALAGRPTSETTRDFPHLLDPGETVFKVFKVHWCPAGGGEKRSPLIGSSVLAVLTNHKLCLAAPGSANHAAFRLDQLTALLVWPGEQGLLLAGQPDARLLLATGDSELTNQLAAAVSMATRKASGRGLPTGRLTSAAMATMVLGKTRWLLQGERLVHVSRVHLHGDACESPLGPTLRGPLMVSTATQGAWRPRHVELKAGVLYEFASESSALPLRCHALASLQRCQLDANGSRPHAFLLSWANRELRMAAADQRQASDWLASIAANSQAWEEPAVGPAPRWLALTNQGRLVAAGDAPSENGHHGDGDRQVAEVDALSAVTVATRDPKAPPSCQLEWACLEARQEAGSDDWLLHFASANQMQAFLSALASQWEQRCKVALPVSEMGSETSHRCLESHRLLRSAWH